MIKDKRCNFIILTKSDKAKFKFLIFTLISVAIILSLQFATAATAVDLGTAGSFGVLAGSGITNTGPTTITGNVGTFPTITETGFGSVTLNGVNHAGDAVTQGAKNDLVTAYNNAAGQTPVTTVSTELGGTTKIAGIYNSADGTFGITGTLKLDAEGNPDSVFIFKTSSTLITAGSSRVELLNGANPCNVFWQVGSSATLGTDSIFKGNILALTSITMTTGANLEGRALARNGAVTLDSNTINSAACIPTLTNIILLPASVNLNVGSTLQLNATCIDQFGFPINNASISYTSSNPSIAIVNPTGLVTGVAPGSSTINAICSTSTTTVNKTSKITVKKVDQKSVPVMDDKFFILLIVFVLILGFYGLKKYGR